MKCLAIFGNSFNASAKPYVQLLITKLEEAKVPFFIHHTYYDLIEKEIAFQKQPPIFSSANDLESIADVLISLGGDGTMLSTIRHVKTSGMPVIGINTGRLGFLASIAKDEIPQAIDALINKEYTIEPRTLLKLQASQPIFEPLNFALNEFTIHKRDSAAMITIHVYLNGQLLNSYWADGLIVATPTGSTAYSLSCGGPILTPDSKNFIITPIAPHNLNVRPLVIPDDKELRIKVEGRSEQFLITLDSRSQTIQSDIELILTKEDFQFNIVKLDNQDFFNTLRNKLMWGIDKRN